MFAAAFWRRLVPRSFAPIVSLSVLNMANDTVNDSAVTLRRHPKYWLDDGSLVVRTQNDLFKVHRTLLHRHSSIISSLSRDQSQDGGESRLIDGCPVVHVPDDLDVSSADFEALLEHLYHDFPLDPEAPFARVASVLRASSSRQLDFPAIHQLARQRLESLFPTGPQPAFDIENPDDALTLAVDYHVYSIQKALFYTLATHANLDHDEPEEYALLGTSAQGAPTNANPLSRFNLSPTLTTRCQVLLDDLIAHFTPILFTVATAGHMACTDVFAEKWMPLVITPALANNGLCHPLETLQTIMDLDWAAEELCEECVREKRAEWRDEQRTVWERMDGWLGLEGKV